MIWGFILSSEQLLGYASFACLFSVLALLFLSRAHLKEEIGRNAKWVLVLFLLVLALKFLVPFGVASDTSGEYIRNAAFFLNTGTIEIQEFHGFGTTAINVLLIGLFGPNYSLLEFVFILVQALTIPLIFLFTSKLANSKKAGLLASLIYLLFPLNIYLSKSLLSGQYAALFLLLSAYSLLLFSRKKAGILFFLATASFALAVTIRLEIIILVVPLAYFFYSKKLWKELKTSELVAGLAALAALFILVLLFFQISLQRASPESMGLTEETSMLPLNLVMLKYIPMQLEKHGWFLDPAIHPPVLVGLLAFLPLFYKKNRQLFWFLSSWLVITLVFYLNWPGMLHTYPPLIYLPVSICCAVSFNEIACLVEKNKKTKKRLEMLIVLVVVASMLPGIMAVSDREFNIQGRRLQCTFSMDVKALHVLEEKCILRERLWYAEGVGFLPRDMIDIFFHRHRVFHEVEEIEEKCGGSYYYFELKRFANKAILERDNKEKLSGSLRELLFEGCTLNVWAVKTG